MNIKEMTKEEASEFLKNKKILCKNEKESLEVQNKFLELRKKLLNLDCIWRTTTKMYYLFFLDNISVFTPIDNYNIWVEDPREELKVQDLLDIQIKEEQKPKFDPNTLQPFNKVLVRDDDTSKWGISFLIHTIQDASVVLKILIINVCHTTKKQNIYTEKLMKLQNTIKYGRSNHNNNVYYSSPLLDCYSDKRLYRID